MIKFRLPGMSRSDRERWRAARSVPDLGQAMADWLEGTIESQPNYPPGYGPDPETASIREVLAATNRSGYLTIGSQPGVAETTPDGTVWRQHAAVEGFVDDPDLLQRLVDAAEYANLTIILHELGCRPGTGGQTVTTRNGAPTTDFGSALSRRELVGIWRGCHRDAVAAVADAMQVTIIDPADEPSDRLWTVLQRALPQPATCPCGCVTYAFGSWLCSPQCSGITNPGDGRCEACRGFVDDGSSLTAAGTSNRRKCQSCGAPVGTRRPYCSYSCEIGQVTASSPLVISRLCAQPRP